MSDQPTYEELVLRCQRLANIIVRNNNATEMLLRAEIKKAKAMAWDECANHISDLDDFAPPRLAGELKRANPYKENQS